MACAQLSKLANPAAENELEKSPKYPFYNGEKRLTGRCATTTRAHALAKPAKTPRAASENKPRSPACGTSGTALAIKDKVLSATTTELVGSVASEPSANIILENIGRRWVRAGENTPREHRAPNRKIGKRRCRQQSKVERNRLGRRSTALRNSDVVNILAAANFAAGNGCPLNRHTTIHFEAAGIADPVAALRQYTKLARDWLRTQGAPFAYIWVREAGDAKGEHAHFLMHVPPDLATVFARRERGWRMRIGAKRSLGAFRSTPVGRSYRHAQSGIQYGESYDDHLAEIVGYLVKGVEPLAASTFGLSRVEPGGELWGKRTGMSENIGRAARGRLLK